MPRVDLASGVKRILGRAMTSSETAAFSTYLDLLATWNRVHRMVGSSDRGWLIQNVVLDSLLFAAAIPKDATSILDLGSGAGVPGIPLAIVRPAMSVLLVESRRKRASFLSAAIREIGLRNVALVHGRGEALIDDPRRFDAVVARCAGSLDEISKLGVKLLAPGGVVVVSASPDEAEDSTEILEVATPWSKAPRRLHVLRPPVA